MEIHQTTREAKYMRYKTAGDYFYDKRDDFFRFMIAKMRNTDYEALVFIHEFVEAYLCWKAGITEKEISNFDMDFDGEGEPGDDPLAPYREQHKFATIIERLVADELGVDWNEYEKAIEDLFK